MNPRFLSLDEVLLVHADQLARYGGLASIRDQRLLESAVAMPQAMFSGKYLHADLAEMAAAYLFHIAQNHPFLDGNKRVAAAACIAFIEINGQQFVADPNAYADLVLEVTRGHAGKTTIAEFVRANVRPAP